MKLKYTFLLPICVVASRLEASRLLEAVIFTETKFLIQCVTNSEGIASTVKISEAHCTH